MSTSNTTLPVPVTTVAVTSSAVGSQQQNPHPTQPQFSPPPFFGSEGRSISNLSNISMNSRSGGGGPGTADGTPNTSQKQHNSKHHNSKSHTHQHHHHSKKQAQSLLTQHLNWFYDFYSPSDTDLNKTKTTSTNVPSKLSSATMNTTNAPNNKTTREDFLQFHRARGLSKFFLLFLFLITIGEFPISLYDVIVLCTELSSESLASSDRDSQSLQNAVAWSIIKLFFIMMIIVCGWMLVDLSSSSSNTNSSRFWKFWRNFSLKWKQFRSKCSHVVNVFLIRTPVNPLMMSEPSSLHSHAPSVISTGAGGGGGAGQRIEISVFREVSGCYNHVPSQPSPRVMSPSPSFFGLLPNTLPTLTSVMSNGSQYGNGGGGGGGASASEMMSKLWNSSKVQPLVMSQSQPGSTSSLSQHLQQQQQQPTTKPALNHAPQHPFSTADRLMKSKDPNALKRKHENAVLSKHAMVMKRMAKIYRLKTFLFFAIQVLVLLPLLEFSFTLCDNDNDHIHAMDSALFLAPLQLSNPCTESDAFISMYALIALGLPYLLLISMPDLSLAFVWCTLAATAIILILITAWHSANASMVWMTILIYLTFAIVLIIDEQIHKVQMFLTTRKLGGILEEKERTSLQTSAQEMRHMIANVAHDLKTVSLLYISSLNLNLWLTFIFVHSHWHPFSPAWNLFKWFSMKAKMDL
jgi:hypothetical protein